MDKIPWLAKNLFNSWFNSLLTLISFWLITCLGLWLFNWSLTEADWTVVTANLRLFFSGYYPVNSLWRLWVVTGVIVLMIGLSWGFFAKQTMRITYTKLGFLGIIVSLLGFINLYLLVILVLGTGGIIGGYQLSFRLKFPTIGLFLIWLLTLLVSLWLLAGGLGLKIVPIDQLSGLTLTLLVAIVSIFLSFPFGILLALGRQSDLPVIRWVCIAYIELIRGLPLIAILFMAQVMLPLVLPLGMRPERVIRAIVGFTLFSAAYLAENVRGGLQSIAKGQVEAAKALGLNPFLVLGLIVLPQALRVVTPAIVGQFISLFKDTSLLAIVGLVDLLGIAQSILANPEYQGRNVEVYLFVAAIYGLFCSLMSWLSRQIEQST